MFTSLAASDFKLLRIFLAAVDGGGFSAAQIALNMSQSTVSARMADLEARLGMILCRRGRRGFALTDDGIAVRDAARRLFCAARQFSDEIQSLDRNPFGEMILLIGEGMSFHPGFDLSRALSRTSSSYPDVRLRVDVASASRIESALLDERAHVGIHVFPRAVTGAHYIPLVVESRSVYRSSCSVSRGDAGGDERIESDSGRSLEAVLLDVMSGCVSGRLPDHYASRWLERGRIEKSSDSESCDAMVSIAVRSGNERVRPMKPFISALRATVEEVASESSGVSSANGSSVSVSVSASSSSLAS